MTDLEALKRDYTDQLNNLLEALAESQAREGLLRDTLAINNEWHVDNGTYPADGCDDISGLLEINQAAMRLPQDSLALSLVLQQRGDFVERIRQFNLLAGNSDQFFNVRQIGLYTGLQCEELAEKLKHIGLDYFASDLDYVGKSFKKGTHDFRIERADRLALLDDDVDQIVVTIGSMLSQGAGIHGALSEVHRANMSKVFTDGTLHKDENGKIVKPSEWVGPDLSMFVCEVDPISPCDPMLDDLVCTDKAA